MIYNNLDKIHNSTWDCGTLVLLVLFCKVFLTAIHSPISWMWQTSIPCPRKSCSYTTTWWTATRCWPERWTSFRDLSATRETDGQEESGDWRDRSQWFTRCKHSYWHEKPTGSETKNYTKRTPWNAIKKMKSPHIGGYPENRNPNQRPVLAQDRECKYLHISIIIIIFA